ncbi:MAG: DNA polymerase III subunit alpha, partial [Spirochaetota bacterium]
MSEYVHLHNHSDYSLLDGASPIQHLVKTAKSFNMKYLALTDHGNMFGALKFYKECRGNGITPILGSEFYVAPGSRFEKSGTEKGNKYHHLILLAGNAAGYENLIALSSLSYTEGFYYKPRIDEELIRQYSEGLICTTACMAGEIPKLILQNQDTEAEKKALLYQEIFGKGNFYLELMNHGIPEQAIINRGLIAVSKKTGIPVMATNDVHYTRKEDANAQDILICIGTNKKRNEKERIRFHQKEFYLKSPEEMFRLFSEIPEALSNTIAAAERCNLEIKLPAPIMLPDYTIPPQFNSPENYLKHLTLEGLKQRYPDFHEKLKTRADYELGVITSMGFTGYFLIVWDFIHFAKMRGIPVGPGRGSGAGSIVAYALNITDIDPLRYGLLFERFLNPERLTMPDFDIDFCFERRQEVIEYVTEKYGKERVCQIITFGTLKTRAVIRDVARVLDIPYAEADQIAKHVPVGPKITLETALGIEPKLKELEEKGGVYKELLDTSRKLEGLHRHASTHAAGIVIGKDPLIKYIP